MIWGPIEELVRLVNTSAAAAFESAVAPKLDLAAFVRYIAVQNFAAQNDGFNGYDGMNNFYFYRLENSTSHVFIAWDEDNAFLQPDFGVLTRTGENELTRRVLEIPAFRTQYFNVLIEAANSAADWLRQEMQRQFDMTNEAMLTDTLKPYSNADYTTARETLLAFPAARITFVRCEVARETGASRPAGCP